MFPGRGLDGEVAEAIGAATGAPFTLAGQVAASGGCINHNQVIRGTDGRRFFLKRNTHERGEMFAAEAAGLEELARAGAIRVPRVIAWGVHDCGAWLALEYLRLEGGGDGRLLGRRLADLHRVGRDRFGWHRDNTIGATPQDNTPEADWIPFYRDHRLAPQLELARRNGASAALLRDGARLMASLGAFFPGYAPRPSLLHGDLWGGNHACVDGEPVLFDPAVYFGDREADLAMTELFGGFPGDFYAAYREAWPLDPGYGSRRELYNLYHVINHFNLFGGGYGAQAERMAARLLAEIR